MGKFLIEQRPGHYVIGTPADRLNKGNEDEFPTFELEDGSLVGVNRAAVKTELKDDDESS